MNDCHVSLPPRSRQSGVALILTLAVLALLMMLTVSFALAAIHSKRIAELSGSMVKARQRCEATLQQLMSMLQTDLSDHTNYQNLYPASRILVKGTGAWDQLWFTTSVLSPSARMTDGMADALGHAIDGCAIVPDVLPAGTVTVNSSWLPVYETQLRDSQPVQVLTERYAFVVIDESGRIDPNAAVDSPGGEGAEPLLGYNVSELNLQTAGLSATFASGLQNQPDGVDWFSRYHIIRTRAPTGSDATALRTTLFAYGRPDTISPMADAFDLSTVGTRTVDEVVAGIPWFANWTMAGDFVSTSARAKNLAANLIDYSDANRDASRDSVDAPTYWGKEKVPWFSRLDFRIVNASYNVTSGSSQPRLQVYCRPELINYFGDLSSYATSCYVNVQAEVHWFDADSKERTQTLTFIRDPMGPASLEGSFSDTGYIRATAYGTAQYSTTDPTNQPNEFGATSVSIRVVRAFVRANNSGDWWDYATTDYSGEFDLTSVGDYMHVNFRSLNPVGNLHMDHWTSRVTLLDRFAAPYTGSGQDCPAWWDTYPIYIRNGPMQHLVELGAILRMEPYAAANATDGFRTFNLIDYKYNGDPQEPGLYADRSDTVVDDLDLPFEDTEGNGGDRNLLDMVRLGAANIAERAIDSRININTQNRKVLEALFKRVTHEAYTGGAPIDPAAIDTFITNLMAQTAALPIPIGIYANYRNPPLYGWLFQDTFTSLPEMQREYLLTMTQQLISAEHTWLSAYVVAQVINDAGPAPPAEEYVNGVLAQLGRFDLGADEILAQQKVAAVLYRNAFTNRIIIVRFNYLTE